MPLTRSKKPSADAAATQEPAAPPSTQDTSKRQRKRPTLFERGENSSPSTVRNKRPKKRARVEPEPLEAAEASQFAAEAQTGDIVFGEEVIAGQGVEDEDNDLEESVDPCPEDEEAVAAVAGAVGNEGVSWEDFEAVARVRYRACLGDLARHPLVASDSFMGVKVEEMVLLDVWGWVDDVVIDLAPRKISVTSLTVVVYPNKQAKSERRQKTIKRDGYLAWRGFKQLAKQLDFESSEALNVDFDLVLSEQKEQVQQVQPSRV